MDDFKPASKNLRDIIAFQKEQKLKQKVDAAFVLQRFNTTADPKKVVAFFD